ncbi:DUF6959 family protein [Streptomyces sp. NPDC056192]
MPLMSPGDVRSDGPMERVEAELLTDGGNSAVVRLPGSLPCRAGPS